jgi:general L-amino acid transport system permease protein
MASVEAGPRRRTWTAFGNDAKIRAVLYQVALVGLVLWVGYEFVANARENLQARQIASGLGFFGRSAGFAVSQSLIPYTEADTYGRVFVVGLLNTLLVAGLGILLTTPLGFLIGIARLSRNWPVARLAAGYVEVVRNLPLLFQILFWYLAVLGSLPLPRQSLSLFGLVFLSNRGIFVPRPLFDTRTDIVAAALCGGIAAACVLRVWAKRRRDATGRPFPVLRVSLGLIVGLPLLTFLALGSPIAFEHPSLRGFNFVGGTRILPEFVALLIALVTYTAAFIAEIVRAGMLAVQSGQTEAAYALGLRAGPTLRLVVVPQALRLIIPPLTGQYLNLTKNSSLAVAIGYPDLVAVFAGTTLSQTGQAIEILAITMLVYLALSLLTSASMNWYNARMRLVEH